MSEMFDSEYKLFEVSILINTYLDLIEPVKFKFDKFE
jgi:hypothetical protein